MLALPKGVVQEDSRPRTQNGHIRNDTRDAWRHVAAVRKGVICRDDGAAGARACTRVTHWAFMVSSYGGAAAATLAG